MIEDTQQSGYRPPGYNGGYVENTQGNFKPETTDDKLKQVYQKQLIAFNQYQKPQIDALQDKLTDTSLTDSAKRTAYNLDSRVRGSTNRLLGDRGLLPSQRAAIRRQSTLAIRKAQGSIVTSANESQRAQRVGIRQNLLRIGEDLTNTGTTSMAQVASEQNARDARNRASSKAGRGGVLSIAGGIIGGIMGGGNPMAAQAGAAIGGAIGNR